MSDTVIRVENLAKRYRLGLVGGTTLVEDFRRAWAKFRGVTDPTVPVGPTDHGNRDGEHIWALRHVSFEVSRGEIVGLIGRNGAGKSTLLKVLTRITAPTEGQALMKGRVGSLLEVGTGFHGELTGIDNIFLSGAVLGMKRAEVRSKLDEIVEFSGCETYIDTPIKRYSSGMRVRLGFAVAAYLEPEILLVDEVLAVGDVAFQQKCVGKMRDVAKGGRTVIFVSHNMRTIENLCPRAILIEDGKTTVDGPSGEVIDRYFESVAEEGLGANNGVGNASVRRWKGEVRFTDIRCYNANGEEWGRVRAGSAVRFRCKYKVNEPVECLSVSVALRSGHTRESIGSIETKTVASEPLAAGACGEFTIEMETMGLRPGDYPLYFWLGHPDPAAPAYDVVDGLTRSLTIVTDNGEVARNRSSDCFSFASRLVK